MSGIFRSQIVLYGATAERPGANFFNARRETGKKFHGMDVALNSVRRHNALYRAGFHMMRRNIISTTGAVLAWAMLLSGCRSTPPSTPAPSERPAEEQAKEPLPTAETPQPLPSEVAAKPPQPTVARLLPESLIAAPEKDLAASRIDYNTLLHMRTAEGARNSFWRYRVTRQGSKLVGFEFSNYGGNRILPPRRDAVKNQFFTRDFQFRFDERARQDIHLLVSDWPPSRDRGFRLSELMNSVMLFFPRAYLPAIVNSQNRNIVTLPTGEEVEFDAATHEIVAGVFSEAPVDLNPERDARRFPSVEYRGKGVVVRADARGADPRTAAVAVITTGTPPETCLNGMPCNRCEVKPQELWEQSGAVRFKFAADADFDRFLSARCGFGLPKLGIELATAPPAGR